jgi:hypothetical protein
MRLMRITKFAGKLGRRRPVGRYIAGKIILKWNLMEWSVRMCTGFI